MSDMTPVIVPKSDQINADDLLSGPITITITDVKVRPGTEQPVSVLFAGSDKAFRPCKSMCRVMVSAWGPDTSKYIGRSLTLYCDPKVKWGGMEVGGIRISHMSHIDESMTMALTVTRANKRPFTVRALVAPKQKAAARESTQSDRAMTPPPSSETAHVAAAPNAAARNIEPVDASSGSEDAASAAPCITADEALILEARCSDNGIPVAKLKAAAKVERLSQIEIGNLARAHGWIDAVLAKREAK